MVVNFNIEGFHRNYFYLWQVITNLTPKLLFLQEIWVPYSEELNMNTMVSDYAVQISTPDQFTHPEDKIEYPGHTWHGAAILWHESLSSHTSNIQNVHSRFTAIKIMIEECSVLAISAYLPQVEKIQNILTVLVSFQPSLLQTILRMLQSSLVWILTVQKDQQNAEQTV